MKALIVGEAPSRTGDPRLVLRGRAGRFLEQLAGLEEGQLPQAADLMNLLDLYPGERFPFSKAKARADHIRRLSYDRIVLLGRNVIKCFGIDEKASLLSLVNKDERSYLLMPHPSGRCRVWNDPQLWQWGKVMMGAFVFVE